MPGNPRRGDIATVARSLKRFGQHSPIVVQRTTGEILIGNHRHKAALSLGWTEIAVLFTDDDRETAIARALADNRSHDNGTYDSAELAELIAEANEADGSLLIDAGFGADEVEALLALSVVNSEPESEVPVKRSKETTQSDEEETTESDEVQIEKVAKKQRDTEERPEYTGEIGDSRLFVGDCLDVLEDIPTGTFHSVVTDPLGGISKERAKGEEGYARWTPGVEFWKEIIRVTKPGAYVAVMAGPATFHRVAVACEDAGMVMQDTLAWLFTGGMTHGLDIGQRVDKREGGDGKPWFKNLATMSEEAKADFLSKHPNDWYGWSTGLKPAWKPILLFRTPFSGSSIDSVVKNGVGAINIDGCRIGGEERAATVGWIDRSDDGAHGYGIKRQTISAGKTDLGRWPSDVVVDEEVAIEIGDSARFFLCSASSKKERNAGMPPGKVNDHPTVRPVDLMRWLVRLITPPGGTVLDPFCGSGTTGVAAVDEGFGFVGIDKNEEWITDIAKHRIAEARLEVARRTKKGSK